MQFIPPIDSLEPRTPGDDGSHTRSTALPDDPQDRVSSPSVHSWMVVGLQNYDQFHWCLDVLLLMMMMMVMMMMSDDDDDDE